MDVLVAMESAASAALVTPELVFFDWQAASAKALLAQLARELECAGKVHASWGDAVVARERTYPTGLATVAAGIALPHADAEHVREPFIAVVRPAAPVVFEPMAGLGDSVPAELVFCLGLTHADAQIETLQLLMDLFADEDRARRVLAAKTPEELVDVLHAAGAR